MTLENLSLSNLTENLHTQFRLCLEQDRTSELELVELNHAPSSPEYESFSLLFRGAATDRLGQGMYRFEHAHLGAFELFIVPVAQDQTGRYYQAVFNRLITQGG